MLNDNVDKKRKTGDLQVLSVLQWPVRFPGGSEIQNINKNCLDSQQTNETNFPINKYVLKEIHGTLLVYSNGQDRRFVSVLFLK